MLEDTPSSETKPTGFWNTTLGTITKITALVSAISGLILAVQPLFRAKEKKVDPAILIDSHKPVPPTKDSPGDYLVLLTFSIGPVQFLLLLYYFPFFTLCTWLQSQFLFYYFKCIDHEFVCF